jgi:hypothetical protein
VNGDWQLAIWNDINYVARMRVLEDGRASFEAFRIFRFEESGRVMYNPGDYETSSDPVSDLEAAQRFVSGEIGVDGWSSIHFNEQERTPLFFSSKGEAASIGLLIARLYDWAHGLITNPKW